MRYAVFIFILVLVIFNISEATFMGVSDTSGSYAVEAGDGFNPRVTKFSATASGTVDSIWAFIATTSSNRHVRMALYNNDRTFVCSTYVTLASPDTGWIVGAASPSNQTVTNGNKYIILVTTAGTENDLRAYQKLGPDSSFTFERTSGSWPSPVTLTGLSDANFSNINGISYHTGGGSPSQPDSLNWVAFDSLHNDFAADSDSVVVIIYAPAQTADSIKLRVITGAAVKSVILI